MVFSIENYDFFISDYSQKCLQKGYFVCCYLHLLFQIATIISNFLSQYMCLQERSSVLYLQKSWIHRMHFVAVHQEFNGIKTPFVQLLSKMFSFFFSPFFCSLKWYKDDIEFYSYIPRMKEGSKKRFFDLPGVFLDVSFFQNQILQCPSTTSSCAM